MSELPFYLTAFVVVIGVLVVVHELGHYLAARACGVKVLRFSVGFGPALLGRRFGNDGTEWSLRLIPLGGYVQMLDEREAAVSPEELGRAFNRQSVGRRSMIVAAGPLANFLLAFVLYWAVFVLGTQEIRPVLGTPLPQSPAAMAGIVAGDEVLAVDGEVVRTWNDFRWQLLRKATVEEGADLTVQTRGGGPRSVHLSLHAPADERWEGDPLAALGVTLYRPTLPAVIGRLLPGGVAEREGLLPGDRVLRIDGQAIEDWHALVAAIRGAPDRSLRIDVERSGRNFTVNLLAEGVSEGGERIGRLGIAAPPMPTGEDLRIFVSHGPLAALPLAARETWDKTVFSLRMIGKMITGEVSLKNLSGPVSIADYAGQTARLGIDYYLKFMALVSLSLGVLNLLPIPVLDGGHLMYHALEVIRRKPLSEQTLAVAQRLGLAILFMLMAFALLNDLNRLFGG